MRIMILMIVLTISISLSNEFLFGQDVFADSPSSKDDTAKRELSREDLAEWEKELTEWEKELRALNESKSDEEAVESEADEELEYALERYELYKEYPPLRRYCQHFSSLTSWNFYGPSDFGSPPYGTADPKDNSFGTDFLLISADEHDHIFITDGLTGEVFRDYFCPLRSWEMVDLSAKITHIVLSPQTRLFAYHKDFQIEVYDTLTRERIHCDLFCGSPLSLSFRKEPLNGCDILELVQNRPEGICRRYFAIPVDPNFTCNDSLSKYQLENLEGVFVEKVKNDVGGDDRCQYFPVFGRANNLGRNACPDSAIHCAECYFKGDLEWMQYMREHTTPESDSKPSKSEDQSLESPVIQKP